jgi:hypothetical protein
VIFREHPKYRGINRLASIGSNVGELEVSEAADAAIVDATNKTAQIPAPRMIRVPPPRSPRPIRP